MPIPAGKALGEYRGRKLYGELTMILTVDRDGRVLDAEVVQTSGNATLDRRAMTPTRGTGWRTCGCTDFQLRK